MIKLKICSVDLSCPPIIQIFVKKSGTHRRRIMSFNPNKLQLQALLTIFKVTTPEEMENKTFTVPKRFSQTNLAFKYLIQKGQLQ